MREDIVLGERASNILPTKCIDCIGHGFTCNTDMNAANHIVDVPQSSKRRGIHLAHTRHAHAVAHSGQCMRRVLHVFNERRKLHQCDNKFRQPSNLMCCGEFCVGIGVCAARSIRIHSLVPSFKYRN